jgi:putative ABC transport system permease protein
MHTLWRDLVYGWRSMRQRPAFTILAVTTLALGIGSATTIFSVIQNVLLDPFPYTDARRIVSIQIHDTASSRPGGRWFYQTAEFLEFQEQNHVFEEAIGGTSEDVLQTSGEGTEQFNGGLVTPNTFRVLGVPAAIGRGLTSDDAKPGAPPVFVMSYKMWAKHHNLDPSIVGRTFVLNGVPMTLVGIMPKRFTKLGADLWRPVVLSRADPAIRERYFMFQAKLKPGVTLQQAQADVDVIARRLATLYPRNYPKQFTVNVVSWVDNLVGQFKKTLYTIAAAVGLLLLIACSNVANMLLARSSAREREMAIRISQGAGLWPLVRQLLVESFLLALGGAALGCLLAYGGIQALVSLIPEGLIPREAEITLNVPALLFSLAVAMLTALLFGLAPAIQTAKPDVVESLKGSGKGVGGGFRGGRLRSALVVIEVALSLVMLTGAGLLIRSFVAMQQIDLGLNPENILVARLPLPRGQYSKPEVKHQFFRQVLQRIQALPGVTSASTTSSLPPYGGIQSEIDIPGKAHDDRWNAIFQLASEGYFPTLGLRILRGRPLSEVEVNDARKVAVVNQTFVTRFFGQEDPIGRKVNIKMLATMREGPVKDPVFEIIGITADAKNQGIQEPVQPEMFIPYTVTGAFERGILVRTATDPGAMLNSVRREIWSVDRGVALTLTGSLMDYLKQFTYAEPRFSMVLLGVFSGVGLLLVAIGVYSMISYSVARQTHEIGIRIALGAARSDVLAMVFRSGFKLLALGVVIGLSVSLVASRVLASQLWGISPRDPLTMAAVIGVVALAGAAACYLPARRATRVDPIIALRYE